MNGRDIAAACAYAADCERRPLYDDGRSRLAWDSLCDIAKESWRRDPTPRPWPVRPIHPLYNCTNYPYFVQADGPWHIYRDAAGNCAAIPRDSDSGHLPSHFGNMAHVARINRERLARESLHVS